MEANFREIVSLLEISAPVFYTERSQLNKDNYVFFQPIGDVEKDAILTGTHDSEKEYGTEGMGLHFSDITASEYYALEENRNPVAIQAILDWISQSIIVYPPEVSILLQIFCVLHEYGHWLFYKSTGKGPYEYYEWERNERKPFINREKDIRSLPDWHPHKRRIARQYHDEVYSQFTSEKYANEYAKERFWDALEKVRNKLGYAESDLLAIVLHEGFFEN